MGVEPTYEELLGKNKKLEQEATLRIEAMVALEERLERYSNLVENASDLIHSVTPDGSFIYVNQAWRDVLGYNLEDLSQIKLMDIVDESCRSKCRNIFNCLLEGQVIDRNETTFVTKDGNKIVVEGRCSTKFEDDKPVAMTGIFRDVSKRVQNDLALRESEEKYRTLFENATDIIQAVSPDGRLLYVNGAWMKTFGYNQEDIEAGLSIFDIISPDCHEHCQTTFQQVISAEKVQHIDTCFVAKDGTPIIIEGNACCKFQNGVPKVTHCIFRDVTEKKKMEDDLFRAQKMEAIGTLAGGIAHDFNNILTAIFGYSELALIGVDDNEALRKYITGIMAGAERAKELVSQILTFSRRTEEKKRPLVISPFAIEALKLLRSSIPTTIDIKHEITSEGVVIADPTQIHQIVMNICTNAYHAMRETGGTLEVTMKDIELSEPRTASQLDLLPGKYIHLQITDTGIGMDAETKKRIYEPYYTTKEAGEGTGLGLAVVHGIVKSHNGRIILDSELGQGTTFHIYLPIAEGEKEEEVQKELDTPLTGGNETIMLVDDEIINVELTKEILTTHGYKVFTFTNGVEAFQKFQQEVDKYDLVITDMTMPYMTGTQLSQKILAIKPNQPIILCTGHSTLTNREKALSMGIKEYCQKPVEMRQLLFSVRKVLDRADTN